MGRDLNRRGSFWAFLGQLFESGVSLRETTACAAQKARDAKRS
jgi:hypothetical protein